MSSRGFMLVAVLIGALAVPGGVSAAGAREAENSTTFQASLPADPAAPAITTVVVSNDDNGVVSFQVDLANRPQLASSDHYVVFLDTDSNASTGDTNLIGAEYAIFVDQSGADLGHWNGSDYDFGVPQSSLVFHYTNGPQLQIAASDLGSPSGFNFMVGALTDDAAGGDPHADLAPPAGHGSWHFDIKITPPSLDAVQIRTAPAKARAGKPFTASLQISTNRPDGLAQATVACSAKVGGHPLKGRSLGLSGGTARCAWQVPRSAKGKTLSGTVTVGYLGLRASLPFSTRVG